MMTASECRAAARRALSGHWAPSVLATVIFIVIIMLLVGYDTLTQVKVLQAVTSVSLVFTLAQLCILNPLEAGVHNAFRKLYHDGDDNITYNMFKMGFGKWWHVFLGMFHMNLLILLWSFLFIIPGIVKSLSYAMTPFILVEHPELSTTEAIHESRLMMKGHKFDLFYLYLTFIGWAILCLFTAGIGYFWLVPYIETAQAAFYYDIKNEDGVLEATLVG